MKWINITGRWLGDARAAQVATRAGVYRTAHGQIDLWSLIFYPVSL